ncbi:transposable element Tc1 transposase [Trichonephila clavipes]|uniref:Transposable element Tc1 transposase n=1 Tax=Trichonephila clavipes TaxID=2585209 RepID=A0A8X6UYR2_TRICX|nr:transposable element Tc1 transposase [Trichonephila clavipes]
MENRKETTIEERKLVIKLSNEGKFQLNIAKVVGRSVNCIRKILQKFKKTGMLANNEGRGRKKIMNSITERRVIHQVKINPKISAPKIAASTSNTLGRSVSAETVRRVLRKAGYNGRVARKKPLIGKRNRVKRLKFAEEHILKPQQFWNEVIFSDESKFNIFGSDGRRMVSRKLNTSHHPKHTIPTVKHGGGSVMVLGCMATSGVGKLVFIDGIMHKMAYLNILQNNLKESADNLGLGSNFIFKQDNDPKHTAFVVEEWLLYHCWNQLIYFHSLPT